MTALIETSVRLQRADFHLRADIAVPARGVTALFGPSGAGKTTLLRTFAGFEPGSGRISVAGEIWQDDDFFLPPHERPVGYVFQESSLFSHLSVAGNLDYGLRRVAPEQRRISRGDAIDMLGLGRLLGRRPDALSGGERKRVAIGRALLRSPRLLLLDEPLASLDLQHKRELMPYLETMHAELNMPVLYVSHVPDEVARLADTLVLIDNGSAYAAGPTNEILTSFALPVAHEYDASAIIETTPGDYDPEFDLTPLQFDGSELQVPGNITASEGKLRVRILARDVSITLDRQSDTSILNIVPATVLEIAEEGGAQVLLRLDAGGTVILARITRKSAATLQIEPGQQVYAQIKTVALLEP